MIDTNRKIPESFKDKLSARFMAIRLGTNSPKTILKYDKINVINITHTELRTLRGTGTPAPTNASTNGSAKLSAANALPKKPANVIATCMVDKKRAG